MKKPKFELVWMWGITTFLTLILSAFMNDIELLGSQKYLILIYLFLSFCISVAVVQFCWYIFPKVKTKIVKWKNEEIRTDFYLSDISDSLFNKNIFVSSVSFPKDAIIYADTKFKMSFKRNIKNRTEFRIPSPIEGFPDIRIPNYEELLNLPHSENILWQRNKSEKVRIFEYGSDVIELFEIDKDNKTFSIYFPREKPKKIFFLEKFGIGQHDFLISFSARDVRGKLFKLKKSK